MFARSATAGDGTFTNEGAVASGAGGGVMAFYNLSKVGNATLIANGGTGGGMGGSIRFFAHSHGDTARVEVFGNGNLDISGSAHQFYNHHRLTVGSIEGSGNIFLGSQRLEVHRSNLDTVFSGVIQDGGLRGGVGGGLDITMADTSTLTFTSANTYTGGTTIVTGALLVNNKGGSGTGSGAVTLHGGALGGKGTIAGAVAASGYSNRGAILSPGIRGIGTLTIQDLVSLYAFGVYEFQLNTRTGRADKLVTNGVTINGAQFSFTGLGKALTPGSVYTVIDNTAATPISGTFSNLPDGSVFTVNGYNFLVNYEGGDGNDLTLTVVP